MTPYLQVYFLDIGITTIYVGEKKVLSLTGLRLVKEEIQGRLEWWVLSISHKIALNLGGLPSGHSLSTYFLPTKKLLSTFPFQKTDFNNND
jgi:hypothetical protein